MATLAARSVVGLAGGVPPSDGQIHGQRDGQMPGAETSGGDGAETSWGGGGEQDPTPDNPTPDNPTQGRTPDKTDGKETVFRITSIKNRFS